LAVVSRFVIDLRVGPRDPATAAELVASVALCLPVGATPPPMLVDNHLPYPSALLQVFGEILRRRRKRRHGRGKNPGLKPPEGFLAGVVHKVRDGSGDVVKVRGRALFGRLKAIEARVVALGIGTTVNTSHIERLNATMRCQQARLARRPRCVSRDGRRLQWSLWLWRDLYNWVRVHGSLGGRTPAMAAGLVERVWSVVEYIRHPVHVDDLTHAIWAEERERALTSALEREKHPKTVPSS
jgi:transposase InsO family protein